jgi:hypothetical protein
MINLALHGTYLHSEDARLMFGKTASQLQRRVTVQFNRPNMSFSHKNPLEYEIIVSGADPLECYVIKFYQLHLNLQWAVQLTYVLGHDSELMHVWLLQPQLDHYQICPRCLKECDVQTCPIDVDLEVITDFNLGTAHQMLAKEIIRQLPDNVQQRNRAVASATA